MRPPTGFHVALALSALAFGCKPKIGDECVVSTDCSASGDRICDTSLPGGYCTIFNCEAGSCPEEAVCVAFQSWESMKCEDPQDSPRFQRTFCMFSCEDSSDCRGGYDCLDVTAEPAWGAEVVESGAPDPHVCMVPYSGGTLPEGVSTGACTGSDASFDSPAWTPAEAGVAGAGGGGGSAGSAGDSGAGGASGASGGAAGASGVAGAAGAGATSGAGGVAGASGASGVAGVSGAGGAAGSGGAAGAGGASGAGAQSGAGGASGASGAAAGGGPNDAGNG